MRFSRKQATGAVQEVKRSVTSQERVRCQLMIDPGFSTRQAKLPQSKSSSSSQWGTNRLRSPNGAPHQQACTTFIPHNAGVKVANSLTVTHTLAWLSKGPEFS